jgi:plastocyanin
MTVLRSLGALLFLALALALAAPAGAATHQVQARDNFFSPATVNIAIGDAVEWSQSGVLPHNVKFDDGSFERPASPTNTPWTESRTFSTPGRFEYYCEQHGGPNGAGMAGVVVVAGAGGGGGGGGTAPTGDKDAPDITKLDAKQSGRSISVTIKTDEAGKATVVVQRNVRSSRLRQVAKVTRSVKAGTTKLSIARTSRRRRLPFARYRVTATVKDTAGNVSSKRTDRVRLRSLRRR